VAASSESVFIRNCSSCEFTIACKQLRTRDCHDCTVFLYSKTEPIIELSDGMVFRPFNAGYPGHADHLRNAGLDPLVNEWQKVFDFNDEAKVCGHFVVRPHNDGDPVAPWYPLEQACELAIPLEAGASPAKGAHDPAVGDPGMQSFGIAAMRGEAATATATGPGLVSHTSQAVPVAVGRKKKSAIGVSPSL
jgi:protein XRP2